MDETFVGGRKKNKPLSHRGDFARGGHSDLTIVAGAKDRATNEVSAAIIPNTESLTLKTFVRERAVPGAAIFTDDAAGYKRMPEFHHASVKHSREEYVRGIVHTNGIESFWSMFKRGFMGTYHRMRRKHLSRYVGEFAGRHNLRDADTEAQMAAVASGFLGKRLRYRDLAAPVAPSRRAALPSRP